MKHACMFDNSGLESMLRACCVSEVSVLIIS